LAAGLSDVLAPHEDVPLYVVSEAMAEAVTGFHVHRGALASLHRRPPTPMSDLLGARRLVVAEDIVDHTNVGALLRNAAGLGWDGVLLAPRAADPLYRRADQGQHGHRVLPAVGPRRRLGHGVADATAGRVSRWWRSRSPPDAIDLDAFVAAGVPDKLAVVVGTEGDGLSAHWIGRRTPSCRFRCSTASTRSMSPLRRRSPAGRCAEGRLSRRR
jgi:tRNA G18 (ribose-2'-O)-methylase SpoU